MKINKNKQLYNVSEVLENFKTVFGVSYTELEDLFNKYDKLIIDEKNIQAHIEGNSVHQPENRTISLANTKKGNEKNYQIFITSAFTDMGIEDEKSVKMYATKTLSMSESIDETNRVEIIEVRGKRLIKGSEPGNYVPVESEPLIEQKYFDFSENGNVSSMPNGMVTPDASSGNDDDFEAKENIILIKKPLELDSARVDMKAFSPTGITTDYKLYMCGIISMLVIIFVGIIIIKKKIM